MASYLMMLGMNFIGLSYILVYVGAVSILFLFILMLINIRISELSSNTSNSIILGLLVIYIFFTDIEGIIIYKSDTNLSETFPSLSMLIGDNISVKNAVAPQWDGNLTQISHISSIGSIIYTNYFIWLILASIILLLAMVGAIIITLSDNKAVKTMF
jgi:NADH-ubiquinone oxidoreductase chain 6